MGSPPSRLSADLNCDPDTSPSRKQPPWVPPPGLLPCPGDAWVTAGVGALPTCCREPTASAELQKPRAQGFQRPRAFDNAPFMSCFLPHDSGQETPSPPSQGPERWGLAPGTAAWAHLASCLTPCHTWNFPSGREATPSSSLLAPLSPAFPGGLHSNRGICSQLTSDA